MATVNPPASGCKQFEVNGNRYSVSRDGRFHGVRDKDAKAMVSRGDCFLPTTTLASGTTGFVCQDCGFVALIKPCGRCGGKNLLKEG